jgi:hypothetical protein
MSHSVNPDDVMALLEDGPNFVKVLAQWLGVSRQELRPVLRQMRAAGALRQLPDHRLALGNYRLPSERYRAELPPSSAPAFSSPPPIMRQEGPTTFRVIDGVEYEVLWNGGPLIHDWPGSGSSLGPSADARPRAVLHSPRGARS